MNNNKSNRCFLLGTGFTHAVTKGESLLTDQLMSKISNLIVPELKDDFEDTFPNIELFMTLLGLRELSFQNESLKKKTRGVQEKIIERIVSLYDISMLDKDYSLRGSFIKKVSGGDCILTLNYDCVLDKYLWLNKRWSPNGGYVLPLIPGTQIKDNKELYNILLLKLHGSCNFRDRGNNQDYPGVEVNETIFPEIYANHNSRNTTLDQGPHVLVMSYIKSPSNGIRQIWEQASDKLKQADRLTIIGCSMRDEDEFLKFALYHFGTNEKIDKFIVEIVDKDEKAASNIKSKVERLFGNSKKQQFQIYKNFDDYLNKEIPI